MTFKTMISAIVLAAVSGAFVAPAFAQDAAAPGMGQKMAERAMGERGPKFDFAQFDANGDGKITQEEFAAARASKVAGLDANSDGKISADELVAQQMGQMTARAEARAKAMVARHDSDGDGVLSAAELATRSVPGDMFGRLDADQDGAVTQAEADAAMAKMQAHGQRGGERRGDHDGHRKHGGGNGEKRSRVAPNAGQ